MQPYDAFTKLDKSALQVRSAFGDLDDVEFWRTQSVAMRLLHVERLRRMNYGHRATLRLQRVLETARR